MEAKIKAALGLSQFTSVRGRGGGGCISQGDAYESDKGMLFVKRNGKQDVRIFSINVKNAVYNFPL
jgi:protein-ribulosamine 3-kinase